MDTEKLAEAKKIATTDKRIKLPIWAWVAVGAVLVIAGAVLFG